jgi:hypothetical protein
LNHAALERDARADMTLGLFGGAAGGIFGWWMAMCHRKFPRDYRTAGHSPRCLSGVPGLTRSRFGVETAITRYVRNVWKLRVEDVPMYGVTHPLKEEKIGCCAAFVTAPRCGAKSSRISFLTPSATTHRRGAAKARCKCANG